MKVNPACVSILIIATSLVIHTPVHLYLAITLALGVLNWAHIVAHTPSLRCLRLLSWDGLNWGSYHGPYTFSKVSSPVVMRRFELGLIFWPLHLL
jgi:hypothetical protein